ncbi:hypothetical protein [Ancylobacter defluvii]|uniref:Uncharacterized protein n=1 Tax=Ancylobacter defluvii TaxID=1282440 RepID=A0A9W6K0U7_9HYPH|nr:hypothetical protein [Ancylobacter defluvii]MBS7588320.1 hypothetical protein [Ancylobacter defluvii]GLK86717.1 hypothetical protein GCM10017653_47870 [Ancylobacter defluvii]
MGTVAAEIDAAITKLMAAATAERQQRASDAGLEGYGELDPFSTALLEAIFSALNGIKASLIDTSQSTEVSKRHAAEG